MRRAGRRDAPEQIVAGVCDEERALTVESDAGGIVKPGVGALTVGEAGGASGEHARVAVAQHLEDTRPAVRDVERAVTCSGDASRPVK